MNVTRWELQNFGAHRHTILEPGAARLVVIQGENGVGKTTLASEALGHALFKDDRGSVNAGVRNGATDSAVSIDFTFAGVAYRAIRRRTTKGAGKSSADLQRRDVAGAWIPVASGDREVPAAVRELLRMDGPTFRTCVSLAQRDLDRFVAATAAGRKEVLASIVVDPRFAPAADVASRRAREAEAAVAADRDALERTADAIAELTPVREVLERRRAELVSAETAIATAATARDEATLRIRELDIRLAESRSIAGEISRLEADRKTALDDWDRTKKRRNVSAGQLDYASTTIAIAASEVDGAAEALPAARERLEVLVRGEAEDRRLRAAIAEQKDRLAAAERPWQQAHDRWVMQHDASTARVRELEEHGRAGTSTCVTCGQPIDEAVALEQLSGARADLRALGEEPKAPLAIARETAALSRLESKMHELAWTPAPLVEARDRLAALERIAARAETIAGARATIERETAAIAEADAELERIRIRGEAIKARLEELQAQLAAVAALEHEHGAQAGVLAGAEAALSTADETRRAAERAIAAGEAQLDRLAVLEAERVATEARLAASAIRIRRLRALAAAFGLKGIPARVIEGVLPELGRHANEVLEQLFGMSLEIRAQRATADGKGIVEALDLVVRKDDVGELELERISGGQATAVSLALAVGLSRLNARRAGTAIRTLVIDEPEGLDVRRLRALGEALRTLAYQGELERVVVITHTAELAEYADLVAELREGSDGPELFIDGIRQEPEQAAALVAA